MKKSKEELILKINKLNHQHSFADSEIKRQIIEAVEDCTKELNEMYAETSKPLNDNKITKKQIIQSRLQNMNWMCKGSKSRILKFLAGEDKFLSLADLLASATKLEEDLKRVKNEIIWKLDDSDGPCVVGGNDKIKLRAKDFRYDSSKNEFMYKEKREKD